MPVIAMAATLELYSGAGHSCVRVADSYGRTAGMYGHIADSYAADGHSYAAGGHSDAADGHSSQRGACPCSHMPPT
jgi:hypothetical protein